MSKPIQLPSDVAQWIDDRKSKDLSIWDITNRVTNPYVINDSPVRNYIYRASKKELDELLIAIVTNNYEVIKKPQGNQ